MNIYKFSVLISNMVGIAGYYAHKPKLSGVLNTGKNVKGSRDQRVREPLLQGWAYCVLGLWQEQWSSEKTNTFQGHVNSRKISPSSLNQHLDYTLKHRCPRGGVGGTCSGWFTFWILQPCVIHLVQRFIQEMKAKKLMSWSWSSNWFHNEHD